jgi:diguanylate cyclase (GGDEF)-like protein/PAS domain S-box-containing protein
MNPNLGSWRPRQKDFFYFIIVLALSLNLIIQGFQVLRGEDDFFPAGLMIGLEGVALYGLVILFYRSSQLFILRWRAEDTAASDHTTILAETRLNRLQQLAQVGDWDVNVITGQVYWSEEIFRIFGRKLNQAPPNLEEFLQYIPAHERRSLRKFMQQCVTQGGVFNQDHAIVGSDGTIRYVNCCGEAIRNPSGKVVHLIGTARDITAQKQLELALQASESRLNNILNTAIAAIFSLRIYRDHTRVYDYISPGVEAIYGYTPADLLATPTLFMDIVHVGDREMLLTTQFASFLAEEQTQVEFRIRSKAGKIHWISSTTVSHRDDTQDCWIVKAVDIDISQRKRIEIERQQADIAIHQQQVLLRQVVDSIPHHLFAKDPEGRFFLANQAAAAVHGTTPQQLVGHFETDFNPYLDAAWLEQVLAVNQAVLESQQAQTLPDTQLISHTGEERWCQVHLTPCIGLDGQIYGIIGNTLDVTDRKQLELALRASEAQLSMTLNAAKASIVSYRLYRDRSWHYLYISSGCEAILGYTAEAMMADPDLWRSRVEPEDWETVFLPTLDDIFAEQPVSLEYRFHHPDNSLRWLATEITSIYEAATDSWVVTLVDIDISDRKRAELAVQTSEARLQAILDRAPYGIFLKDLEGCYTYVNAAYEQMSHLTADTLLGKNDREVFPATLAATFQLNDQAALAANKPILFEEENFWQDQRHTFWTTKFALRQPTDDAPYAVCGMMVDITERKAIESTLRQQTAQERMLSRVINTMRSSLDLETIFATAVEEVVHLIDLCQAVIVQYRAAEQCWQHVVEYRCRESLPDTAGLIIPDADNPLAERLKRLEVVRVDDTEALQDAVNCAHATQFPGSWLLVPLVVNDQLWGSFSLFREPPITPFSDQQVALVQRLANQLAIAIQQSTLYGQLQVANQQLQYLATHDSLTKLANRRHFDDQIIREWSRLIRIPEATWIALILCDIDYFKQYNDLYGHPEGDACLLQVAQALSDSMQRPTDFLARYGGEEFAVILPDTDRTGAVHVVQQLQTAIAALWLPHGASPIAEHVTLSFGIACIRRQRGSVEASTLPTHTSDVLIYMADKALYQAKSQGRNRYEVSTDVVT